jgi:hypothetical protein
MSNGLIPESCMKINENMKASDSRKIPVIRGHRRAFHKRNDP